MNRKWMHAVVAVLVAATLTGCAGGGRSGSDRTGVDTPPTEEGQPAAKKSLGRASEPDLAAALRRADVDDPQGWARALVAARPYPPGEQGTDRIRQVLVDSGAEPAEIDRILTVVEP